MRYATTQITLDVCCRDAQTGQALPEVRIGDRTIFIAEAGRDFGVHFLAHGSCFSKEGSIHAACKIALAFDTWPTRTIFPALKLAKGSGKWAEYVTLRQYTPACIKGWWTPRGGRQFRMVEIVAADGLAPAPNRTEDCNVLEIIVDRHYGTFVDRQGPSPHGGLATNVPVVRANVDSKKWLKRASLRGRPLPGPIAVQQWDSDVARLRKIFSQVIEGRRIYTGKERLANFTAVLEDAACAQLRQRKQQRQRAAQTQGQPLIAAGHLVTTVGPHGEEIILVD